MTDTSKREDMIEEAAKAIHGVAMQEYPAMEEWRFGWMQQKDRDRNAYLREAEAALAVFEKACTPTEDEREALAVLISVYINETDDSGDLPKTRGLAEQILAGFRRTAAQEPSAAPTVRDHVRDLTGATDAELDELGGFQGEPSDAEVFAAARALQVSKTAAALMPLLNRVRAEAIRDATRVFAEGGWIDTFTADVVDDVTAVHAADRWFTAHAATIEQNSEGNGSE